MDYKILGVSIYYLICWFYIYSFIGWAWESMYVSSLEKRWVNRGFVTGPVCTIYGCGALMIYMTMKYFSGNILALFFGGMVLATLVEYITGVLLETVFHASWWDYSTEPLNLNGYVCLSSSLAWGAFTVILFRTFQPFVEALVALFPEKYGIIAIAAVTALYLFDLCMSGAAAFKLRDRLKKLDEVYIMMAEKVESSKLYATAEDIRANIIRIAEEISPVEFAEKQARRLEIRKTVMYEDLNYRAKRILNAYPQFRSVKEKARDAAILRVFSLRLKKLKNVASAAAKATKALKNK